MRILNLYNISVLELGTKYSEQQRRVVGSFRRLEDHRKDGLISVLKSRVEEACARPNKQHLQRHIL